MSQTFKTYDMILKPLKLYTSQNFEPQKCVLIVKLRPTYEVVQNLRKNRMILKFKDLYVNF